MRTKFITLLIFNGLKFNFGYRICFKEPKLGSSDPNATHSCNSKTGGVPSLHAYQRTSEYNRCQYRMAFWGNILTYAKLLMDANLEVIFDFGHLFKKNHI